MTTFNTGNPLGSTDARDLYDNAENFDRAVNQMTLRWTDRFGVSRRSWAGMAAYVDLGDYAADLLITGYNEIFRHEGEFYRAGVATVLPYTTSGSWSEDGPYFVPIGDAALRQDIVETADMTIGYYRNAVNCNQFGGLNAALANSDTLGKIVVVTDAQVLTADVSIEGRALVVEYGGIITTTGHTLTINGPFSAGDYQVFTGIGTVAGLKEARPEWWGTNAAAMTTALNQNGNNPSTIILSNKTYDITGGVTLTSQYKTIEGNGAVLSGGSITIGAGTGSPVDMHYKIRGVTFSYDTLTTSQPGIVLRRSRYGEITGNRFVNCSEAILIEPVDAIQHVNRLKIIGNQFSKVNYALYSDGYLAGGGTKPLTVGDADFSDNHYCSACISHIYTTGQDGLNVINNYFFFPGYAVYDTNKEYNIYAKYLVNSVISGNQMFEAGLDAIHIIDARRTVISNNTIVWPGQAAPGSGIYLTDATLYGAEYNTNSISGNIIRNATLHGIYVLGQNQSSVQDNIVGGTGLNTYYYGTSPTPANLWSSITHYTVNLGETVGGFSNTRMLFTNNNLADVSTAEILFPSSSKSFLNVFYGNLEITGESRRVQRTNTESTTNTSIVSTGYNVINFNQSGATTVVAITGGYNGKVIQLLGFNANTTLDSSASGETVNRFELVGGDVTLAAGNIITLQYFNDRWKETSRNF